MNEKPEKKQKKKERKAKHRNVELISHKEMDEFDIFDAMLEEEKPQQSSFHLFKTCKKADTKQEKKQRKKEKKTKRDEEISYFKQRMDELVRDEKREQLSFPATLEKGQRKQLHRYASNIGLKTVSKGIGKIFNKIIILIITNSMHELIYFQVLIVF